MGLDRLLSNLPVLRCPHSDEVRRLSHNTFLLFGMRIHMLLSKPAGLPAAILRPVRDRRLTFVGYASCSGAEVYFRLKPAKVKYFFTNDSCG